jgi:hypothetical protein
MVAAFDNQRLGTETGGASRASLFVPEAAGCSSGRLTWPVVGWSSCTEVFSLSLSLFLLGAPHLGSGSASAGTARLSWDPSQIVVDRSAPITDPVPLYVILEGVTDVRALGPLSGSTTPCRSAAARGSASTTFPAGGAPRSSMVRRTPACTPSSSIRRDAMAAGWRPASTS